MKSYKKMVSSTKETTRELYEAIHKGNINVADIVEEGNMKPVTSNAVAKALKSFVDKTSKVTIKVVNESTAELVANANVSLGTNTQKTSDDGQAKFNDVKFGNYLLTVSKEGFSEHSESIIIGDETYINTIQLIPENVGDVTFHLTTPEGEPAQAEVEMNDSLLSTDEKGECTFKHVPYGDKEYVIRSNYSTQTGTVRVNDDKETVILTLGTTTAIVSIKVINNSTGKPEKDATVEIVDIISGTTDNMGSAVFENVELGNYSIRVTKTGFYVDTEEVGVTEETFNYTIRITPSQTTNTTKPTETSGAIVPISNNQSTVVVRHKNKYKANRYPIEIVDASNNNSISKGETNKRGEFKFEVEPNIEKLICRITMDNKNIESYELGNSNETNFNITIPDEDRGTLILNVDYGKGLYYSLVQLGNHEESTGEDKSCIFEDLKYGTYNLTITTKYFFDYTDTITIDSTRQKYKAVLKPKLTDLTVHVKNAFTEDAIENATVTINKQDKTTDKDGNVTFKLLREDMTSVQGKHEDYEPNHIIIDANSENSEVTLYLTHNPANANFKVVNQETKEPIQYAFIKLGKAIGESDKDGKFTFKNLEHGNYYLNVSAVNYDEYLGDVDIKSNEQDVNIELKPLDSKKETTNKKEAK